MLLILLIAGIVLWVMHVVPPLGEVLTIIAIAVIVVQLIFMGGLIAILNKFQ